MSDLLNDAKKMDRMSLPGARKVASDMLLEIQVERTVGEVLAELYVEDRRRRWFRWGKDIAFEDVRPLVERITERVVYGR